MASASLRAPSVTARRLQRVELYLVNVSMYEMCAVLPR